MLGTENTATEDGGRAFAKGKNYFSFFAGELTVVCEPAQNVIM
jgi:hypothetical protein